MTVLLERPFVVDGVRFDRYHYDDWTGELHFRVGPSPAVTTIDETPEDHHLRLDEHGKVFSLMLIYPRMQLEERGFIDVTLRDGGATIRLTPELLAPFLVDTTQPAPASTVADRIAATLRAIRPTRRRFRKAASAAVWTWKAS